MSTCFNCLKHIFGPTVANWISIITGGAIAGHRNNNSNNNHSNSNSAVSTPTGASANTGTTTTTSTSADDIPSISLSAISIQSPTNKDNIPSTLQLTITIQKQQSNNNNSSNHSNNTNNTDNNNNYYICAYVQCIATDSYSQVIDRKQQELQRELSAASQVKLQDELLQWRIACTDSQYVKLSVLDLSTTTATNTATTVTNNNTNKELQYINPTAVESNNNNTVLKPTIPNNNNTNSNTNNDINLPIVLKENFITVGIFPVLIAQGTITINNNTNNPHSYSLNWPPHQYYSQLPPSTYRIIGRFTSFQSTYNSTINNNTGEINTNNQQQHLVDKVWHGTLQGEAKLVLE